jgi:hypothetical protein
LENNTRHEREEYNMKFTFGIITKSQNNFGRNDPSSSDKGNILKVIQSIKDLNIPEYEIIIVGGENIYDDDKIRHFEFDDTIKPLWITPKKNIITRNAKYDNIVFSHDYIYFSKNWYEGFLKFGDEWDICMNRILNEDGSRFRDWCSWDDPEVCFGENPQPPFDVTNPNHRIVLVPYNYNRTEHMYISGTYWVSKKYVMEKEPLNEDLYDWGQAEDVDWSKRVREKYKYVMNDFSSVQSLKYKNIRAEVLK